MNFWVKYIRYIIMAFSFIFAVSVYVYFSDSELMYVSLVRTYALTALAFLYLAMLATPLYSAFPGFPLRTIYIKARRALGVSAFMFGFLHAFFAFNKLLGGFAGLQYLDNEYTWATRFSFTALVILSLMAATSTNWAAAKLGRHWKQLHRFVYIAGLLIITHFLMIGTDFSYANPVSITTFIALTLLFVLEALRVDKYIYTKFPGIPHFNPTVILTLVGIGYFFSTKADTFHYHSEYLELGIFLPAFLIMIIYLISQKNK